MAAARLAAWRAALRELPPATRYLLAALLACTVWILLWPGDIPWINDEPVLLDIARLANHDHRLALLGLSGSVGVRYGPVPAWFYQACLLVTHDPVAIGLFKTALSLALLGWGCGRLAQRLELPPAPLLLIFLSPYVYMYTRQLWDNSLTLVLSPLLLYACVETMRRRSFAAWVAALALSWLLIHCHLNNALIIIPCLGVVLASEWRWLTQPLGRFVAVLGVAALAVVPYALYVRHALQFSSQYQVPLRDTLTGVALGARYFSYAGWGAAQGWPVTFVPEMFSDAFLLPPTLTGWLVAFTGVAVAWFVIGLGFVGYDLWVALRAGRAWTVREKYALIVVLTLVLSAVFFGVTRQIHQPHYLVGTWMTYGYCVWRGAAWLLQQPRRRWWFWAHVGALAVLLVTVKLHLHLYGGNREPSYGHTLANQLELVRAISAFAPASPLQLDGVYTYQHFPHAYYDLRDLVLPDPLPADWAQRPRRQLRIDYAVPADKVNGWLTLEVSDAP